MKGNSNPAYKHGHTQGNKFSPEYQSWATMWTRCTNRNRPSWKHYGGKGITVCDRWQSFENFYADMGPRPDGMTLERINSDKGYSPDNCKWASKKEQARNVSHVKWVTIKGERKKLLEWCEELGISVNTVRCRVNKHGWSYQKALTTPVQSKPFTKNGRNPINV